MKKETYEMLEGYMHSCMTDSAHDPEHIYRVLYSALQIAQTEENVNYDVLIAACLLHDIGRKEQFEDPSLCHAEVGAKKAFGYLLDNGFSEEFAEKVRHCILTHRFRKSRQPETLEAKILFDADKLDVTGTMGIARTLMYKADMKEPLYRLLPDGTVSDGTQDIGQSFFREYKVKLEKLYDRFYTEAGAKMAQQYKAAAAAFYESLYQQISSGYSTGADMLNNLLK